MGARKPGTSLLAPTPVAVMALLGWGAVLLPASLAAQGAEAARVAEILRRADVQRAFHVIEELEPTTLSDHVALTQIPAPPFGEGPRGARYAELLREAGADSVWTDAEGNVVALRRGRTGGRTVAIGGHLDTVFPEGTDVTVRQRGDTLFAPGIGDDTRGLIVVLTVLRAMESAGLETAADVWFVGTVGEEGLGDLRGMKHLFREGAPAIDAWIEVDGGGLDGIVNQGLGSHRYLITFRGPGGHSWGAFGLANPAHALARAVARFEDAADRLTGGGPRTSYNVGRIGGGTSVNSIPFEAWMEVDMRSESPASLERVDSALQQAVREALDEENRIRREGEPLTVSVEMIGNRPSGEIDPETPLVRRAVAATRLLGGAPELGRSSTNSNVPIALGVPAVTIGRGGVGGDNHSPGEWWINRNGHLAIQRALLLLMAEAGVPPVGDDPDPAG